MVGVGGTQPRSLTSMKGAVRPANTGYTPADRMLEKAAKLTIKTDEITAQVRLR